MGALLETDSYVQLDGHDTGWINWMPGALPKAPDTHPLTNEMVNLSHNPRELIKNGTVLRLIPKIHSSTPRQTLEKLQGSLSFTEDDINLVSERECQKAHQRRKEDSSPLLGGIKTAFGILTQRSDYLTTCFPYFIPEAYQYAARELQEEFGVEITLGTNTPAYLESLVVGFNQRGGLWDSLSDTLTAAMRLERYDPGRNKGVPNAWFKLSVAWIIKAVKDYEDARLNRPRSPLYVFEDGRPSGLAILRDIEEAVLVCPLSKEEFEAQPYPSLPENIGSFPLSTDRILFNQNLYTVCGLADKGNRTYHFNPGPIREAIVKGSQAAGHVKSFFYHVPETSN